MIFPLQMQSNVAVIRSNDGGKKVCLLRSGPISMWNNLMQLLCVSLNTLSDLSHPVYGTLFRSASCDTLQILSGASEPATNVPKDLIKAVHTFHQVGVCGGGSSEQLGTGPKYFSHVVWQSGCGRVTLVSDFCLTQTLVIWSRTR